MSVGGFKFKVLFLVEWFGKTPQCLKIVKKSNFSKLKPLLIRGATALNLSSFELIELLIFGLGPGSGFGPIKNFELRASKKPGIMVRAGPGSGSGLYNSA